MSDSTNAARKAPSSTALSQGDILARLRERFGEAILDSREHAGQTCAVVARDSILPVLEYLRGDPELAFDMLADVTVVDHLYLEVDEVPERFAVVYCLNSIDHRHRFRLKVPVPEADPVVPSASDIWKSALWGEREAHDMYGIVFDGNPDLRRLLMPADFDGFPLRKDYPLHGRGERDSFVKLRRGDALDSDEAPTRNTPSA